MKPHHPVLDILHHILHRNLIMEVTTVAGMTKWPRRLSQTLREEKEVARTLHHRQGKRQYMVLPLTINSNMSFPATSRFTKKAIERGIVNSAPTFHHSFATHKQSGLLPAGAHHRETSLTNILVLAVRTIKATLLHQQCTRHLPASVCHRTAVRTDRLLDCGKHMLVCILNPSLFRILMIRTILILMVHLIRIPAVWEDSIQVDKKTQVPCLPNINGRVRCR
mmetsp:Transcript_27747/g.45882  ORF Transcript_27747/g.45882 Transcript_27747/m.45882 type:complete len:222 (-) Transcript_27747:2361-3026(-)